MVAYNFQQQFAERIADGSKTHTIRRNGKRRHARPGERLQLYTGMRTRSCRKIIADPLCIRVAAIWIEMGVRGIASIEIDDAAIEDLDAFAKSDGFADLAAMSQFWRDFHGLDAFGGSMIFWDWD
jgi:hypothetical protein